MASLTQIIGRVLAGILLIVIITGIYSDRPLASPGSGISFAESRQKSQGTVTTNTPDLANRDDENKGSRPNESGWFEIPGTKLTSLCPEIPAIQGVEGCEAIVAEWGSALADTKRNRLVLWGGGHNGYFGNEFYALDVSKLTMERLTEPSAGEAISNLGSCPESYLDGKPNSRHDYNGLQYVNELDVYFVFGAALSPCGSFTNTVWTFDPAKMIWTRRSPKIHPNAAQNGSIPLTAYNSANRMIYEVEANTGVFWQYDINSDNWKELAQVSACGKLNMTSAIDPNRKLYFCIGNNSFSRISLTGSHTAKNLRGAGCSDLVSASGPGFDFDSFQNRMVGWSGGNSVYIYDEDEDSCVVRNFPGGPGRPQPGGTYGRFRYFPAQGVFALVNDGKENGYLLRLTPVNTKP